MIEVFWTPPTAEASAPILPGYSSDGRQQLFQGERSGDQVVYHLPDMPQNRKVLEALPPAFSRLPDPRQDLMVQLRQLGIPHRRNEKLETLLRKLAA